MSKKQKKKKNNNNKKKNNKKKNKKNKKKNNKKKNKKNKKKNNKKKNKKNKTSPAVQPQDPLRCECEFVCVICQVRGNPPAVKKRTWRMLVCFLDDKPHKHKSVATLPTKHGVDTNQQYKRNEGQLCHRQQ